MTSDEDAEDPNILGFMRPTSKNFMPPPSYSTGLGVMTATFVHGGQVIGSPVDDYVGADLVTVKYDWVDKLHISTLKGLNKYVDDFLDKGKRSIYVRKEFVWMEICCDKDAVVQSETFITWSWFLRLLKRDLQMTSPEEYTFISDKQKGLLKAFDEELPGSSHRYCALHLWKNMFVAGHRGDGYRNAFFKASYATTIGAYRTAMKELGELDPKALDWLRDKHPSQWSKSHFATFPKCDNALNNGCENFNKVILDARKQPIITMNEWIREYMMKKLRKSRDKAARYWKDKYTPVVKIAMNKNISQLRFCTALKSDETHYQITENNGDQFCVDLARKSCSCRRYDLTGIPCKHVVSAVAAATKEDAYSYVHDQYTVENYKRAYKEPIYGINGAELWGESYFIPPLPPNFGRKGKKGKPQRARRKGVDELNKKGHKGKGTGITKSYSVTCSYCGTTGHNIVACQEKAKHICEEEDMIIEENEVEIRARTGEDELMAEAETLVRASGNVDELNMSQFSFQGDQSQPENEPPRKKLLTNKVRQRYCTDLADCIAPPTLERQMEMTQAQPTVVPSPFPPNMNVRAPPLMQGNQFLNKMPSQSSSTTTFQPFVVGGKKFVTLSQIPNAIADLNKKKKVSKSKKKT